MSENIYYSNCDFPGKNILKVLLFIFSTMGPTSPNSFSLAHHSLLHQIEIVGQSHCIYTVKILRCFDRFNNHIPL